MALDLFTYMSSASLSLFMQKFVEGLISFPYRFCNSFGGLSYNADLTMGLKPQLASHKKCRLGL